MLKLFSFIFFIPFIAFSQNIKISGTIKDKQNRSVERASVVILDNSGNILFYTFANEEGNYTLQLKKPASGIVSIEISCLGFAKNTNVIDLSTKTEINHSISLESQQESLKEVVIESHKKVRINQDTTTIKASAFSNQTEQTIEDILKKLPGIEVQKDGSIKAHGKPIDKLLVEGEDLFDKNYTLLSKNLDAKTLDEVQIIEAFEDNPIFKKMNNSDKVALNLKLKKDKQNIWFGNITAGAGIISENRWKEGINLGLLKKKIKIFYLADYNNSGEKATSLIKESSINLDFFGTDRIEKKARKQYVINSNENNSFSKSQSVFNKALFNSLSFTTKLKPSLTLRGVGYFTNDHQIQHSFSETIYNIDPQPIINSEANHYSGKKTLSSGEIELKYSGNEDNYLTNLFIYKNNPDVINSNLLFNNEQINQNSKNSNYTFYNHLNHSYSLSNQTILNNYIYLGSDYLNEKNRLKSPFLNEFLKIDPEAQIDQKGDTKNQYFGIKSKLISKYKKLESVLAFQYEKSKESIVSDFLIDQKQKTDYQVDTNLNQSIFSLDAGIRYNFTSETDFRANLKYVQNNFARNISQQHFHFFNPVFSFNLKKTRLGTFRLNYSENSSLPEINYLKTNYLLADYRTFEKGVSDVALLKNKTISFLHTLYKDEKGFSVKTNLVYTKLKKTLNIDNLITQNFNFKNYIVTNGGENYNASFSFINYLKKLKWATKIATQQTWSNTPTKVNNQDFTNLKSYNSQYSFSATSYYSLVVNFDFGFNYNYYQTNFNNTLTTNTTKDAFINCNYKISKVWLAEVNTTYYKINTQNYSFVNIIANYTPENSRFSYRLLFNNVTNENEFTLVTLDNYTSYKATIDLVPRYLLATVKYRF